MICRKCKADKPENKFSIVRSHNTYTKQDGTVSHYYHSARRKVCNTCIHRQHVKNHAYTVFKRESSLTAY